MNCLICDSEPCWVWTDTHGIAQCDSCGTPYRISHYEDGKRVEKPPLILVLDAYIPVLRRYHNEVGRTIPSGFSFPGGQEMATDDEIRMFNKWLENNADAIIAAREKEGK